MTKKLYFTPAAAVLLSLFVAGMQISSLAQVKPAAKPPEAKPAESKLTVPAAPGDELISPNISGEETVSLGNYWDGVDSDDNLHVYASSGLVLNDIGQMADTAMPSFPNFVDMNGDSLKDLVVADTHGFVWIYQNSGKKGKPQFTTGKFVPTFIGWGSKIHVCDWDGDGLNDIVVGTYYGDIVVLKNIGTRVDWKFTRKMGIPRYIDPQFNIDDPQERAPQILMGKKPMIQGNYLSPWVCDWNKDSKPDLLFGEGTYSANSVRMILNIGARAKPAFAREKEFYLSYGEGFEQLVPCVVDYNGDGLDDLIVGTRTGQIRLHKGTKKAIEGKDLVAAMHGNLAPAVLEYEGNLKLNGKDIFSPMSTPYACDWNEDGLFDLLLGSQKGLVMIALNTGTKTEPKFETVEPIKGTDVEKDLLAPSRWWNGIARVWRSSYIGGFCNSAVLMTCETNVVLKQGAAPIKPVNGDYFIYFRYVHDYPGRVATDFGGGLRGAVIGARTISLNQGIGPIRIGKKYEFTLSALIVGGPVGWVLWSGEQTSPATDLSPGTTVYRSVRDVISPSSVFVKHTFKFKAPQTVATNLNYTLDFQMPEGDCKFLFDNLTLKEVTD